MWEKKRVASVHDDPGHAEAGPEEKRVWLKRKLARRRFRHESKLDA